MTLKTQQERFDEWITEHIGILYRTVNGFAEGEDRKDLMQNVLLAVWKAIPGFREQSRPSTFIYRVAHNTALTWKRSQTNYHHKLNQYESLMPSPAASDRGAPEHGEMLERLYEAIRKLPPLDRSLVLLFLDDVSYREMSEIHGLTESNVGVRLNRLKHKLAQLLNESTYES